MKNNWFSPKMLFIYSAMLLMIVWRVFVEIPNFTPIMAVALFGGAYLGRKHLAFILPLLVLLVSDLIIGLHNTMIFVYLGFALAVGLGILIRRNLNFWTIFGGALASAVFFFLFTNFGVWMSGTFGYPMNFAGLMESYIAAIPFFRTQLISTLAFSGVLFGVYSFIKNYTRAFALS
jgi:hypothetical protein